MIKFQDFNDGNVIIDGDITEVNQIFWNKRKLVTGTISKVFENGELIYLVTVNPGKKVRVREFHYSMSAKKWVKERVLDWLIADNIIFEMVPASTSELV